MKQFIKAHRRGILMTVRILLLGLIILFIAISVKWIDLGIDVLTKTKKATTHYGKDIKGQLHLQSDKSKFPADDAIFLTLRTAYYDTLEQAERADFVSFRVIHSDYLEVIVAGASECYPALHLPENDPDPNLPENDVDNFFEITDFNAADLVYQPVGSRNRITRASLPYEATITIKVKPNAPESFTDELWIFTYSDDLLVDGDRGSRLAAGIGKSSKISIRIVRDGDTVKIYA